MQQTGTGKGDAVRLGFERARGDILMILDADLTVPPEDLPRFYDALVGRKGDFVNGVRLVYPMEEEAMRFANLAANKFFSFAFSWLLGQPVRDTLCGTKVLWKRDYERIAANRSYFGDLDPFGAAVDPSQRSAAFAGMMLAEGGQPVVSRYNNGQRAICCMVEPLGVATSLIKATSSDANLGVRVSGGTPVTGTTADIMVVSLATSQTTRATDSFSGSDANAGGRSLTLTVNGSPLYTWQGDTKPGDTKGQGIINKWQNLLVDLKSDHMDAQGVAMVGAPGKEFASADFVKNGSTPSGKTLLEQHERMIKYVENYIAALQKASGHIQQTEADAQQAAAQQAALHPGPPRRRLLPGPHPDHGRRRRRMTGCPPTVTALLRRNPLAVCAKSSR